ncbi:OmpA family protein [Aquicoccus sp. SCR17]|nr:OmpA family protein [Carideicomes alvinocaridis]
MAVAIACVAGTADAVMAQDGQGQRVIRGERYVPGISITPDGCEVWVMDDGAEGYADTRLTRDGRPICHDVNQCGVVNTDQFFATDKYYIRPEGKERLAEFFRQSSAFGFIIVGHTDSRASDAYNMRLSYNRANSVASVAQAVGARILDVRGYGERMPVATNATRDGMARNRRVEILCVN